jgi:hypothetical protein
VLHGKNQLKFLQFAFFFFSLRCKKCHVPLEKIYSKTQREKFRWAIDMATADFHFHNYEGEIVLRNVDDTNNDDDDDDDEQQNSDDE